MILKKDESDYWTSQLLNNQMKNKKRTTADEDSNQRMV
jgi:hypothetical protein